MHRLHIPPVVKIMVNEPSNKLFQSIISFDIQGKCEPFLPSNSFVILLSFTTLSHMSDLNN